MIVEYHIPIFFIEQTIAVVDGEDKTELRALGMDTRIIHIECGEKSPTKAVFMEKLEEKAIIPEDDEETQIDKNVWFEQLRETCSLISDEDWPICEEGIMSYHEFIHPTYMPDHQEKYAILCEPIKLLFVC
jgi:hypothetical protein